MKISKKCRYGLRALIDLSMHSGTEYMVLGNIAERNNISPQYLEQVFAGLRRAGIVKGVKGSQGGYRLNIPPEELTVSEIIVALDGSYQIEPEEMPEDSHGRGVAAEIIGMPQGSIGQMLYMSKIYLDTSALLTWTVIIVVLSVLFEKLVVFGLELLLVH